MGRYAKFSTGVEYKFAFALQNSADMQEWFGVTLVPLKGSSQGYHVWYEWDDAQLIWNALCKEMPNVSEFEAFVKRFASTTKGTEELRWQAYNWISERFSNAELTVRLVLGCMIWHQLQYCNTLFVAYAF